MTKICCRGFEAMLENNNKSGLSIEKHTNQLAPFKLVSRAFNKLDEERLLLDMKDIIVQGKLNLSDEVAIRFCPWCGTELKSIVI